MTIQQEIEQVITSASCTDRFLCKDEDKYVLRKSAIVKEIGKPYRILSAVYIPFISRIKPYEVQIRAQKLIEKLDSFFKIKNTPKLSFLQAYLKLCCEFGFAIVHEEDGAIVECGLKVEELNGINFEYLWDNLLKEDDC